MTDNFNKGAGTITGAGNWGKWGEGVADSYDKWQDDGDYGALLDIGQPPSGFEGPWDWYHNALTPQYKQIEGPTYDDQYMNEARSAGVMAERDQARASRMYLDAALGKGPSAAQATLNQATQANIAAQQSAANSARGGSLNQAMAQRNAIYAGEQAQQQAANQAAILRAQEQQNAMTGYAGMANSRRASEQQRFKDEAEVTGQRAADQLDVQKTNAGIYNKAQDAEVAFNQDMARQVREDAPKYIMSMFSDERLKTGVKDVSDDDILSFLTKAKPKEYRYKPEAGEDSRQHYGVMAQDLERDPIGRTLVIDTPAGKQIDVRNGFGTLLAAQNALAAKQAELEALLKKGRR